MGRALLLVAALGLWLAAHAGCAEGCVDDDGDGTGDGCPSGADCDDGDPTRTDDCDAPPPDCEAEPFARGCPCLTGSGRDCYAAEAETIGVGACRAGRQQCFTGRWTECTGEMLPKLEACNGEDDDCDGTPDEGVLSPCGGCDPTCAGGVWGSPADPFEPDGDLVVTSAGELTLAFTPSEGSTVWVPNTGEGTLSKIDAIEALEVARYRTGGTPERIAVDHNGDAWVLAPSTDAGSRLTKVAGDATRCVDRDGDGIDTSTDPNAMLPAGEDECVLFDVPVGSAGELARTLAIDGARSPDETLGGNVWIGLQHGARLLELDGRSGEILREVALPGVEAYASAFDPWGTLWVLDRDGVLARVDTSASPPVVETIEAALGCYTLEGLASDRHGVLTLTGGPCETVVLYEPLIDRWRSVKAPGVLTSRGVAALDTTSWISFASGSIGRVDRDPLDLDATFSLADDLVVPLDSTAIGADARGRLWIVSARGGTRGRGVVSRFDPDTEEVDAQVVVGRLPTAHGDLTGLQRLGVFVPEGSATHVFEGCGVLDRRTDAGLFGPPSEWQRLHVAWTSGPGAHVVVEARRANDRASLADEPFVTLGELPADEPPFPLDFERGGVIEVRLTLHAEGRLGAPRIARVGAEWHCPGPD